MLVKDQNQTNFIYGDIEEEQPYNSPQTTQLVQLLQTVKMNNQNSEIKPLKMKTPPNLLQYSPVSEIVFIKPSKQNYQKEEQKIIQIQNLGKIQKKPQYEYRFMNSQSVVFPQEQMEESQQSPQSSLRKLYKRIQKQENSIKPIQIGQQVQYLESQKQQYNDSQDQQYHNPRSQVRSKSLRELVLFSVPKLKRIKCLIKIVNDSIFSLEVVYHLYLVEEKKLLLTARKKRFRFSSRYEIFGIQKGHLQNMGLVKSNFSRTQYKLIYFSKKISQQTKSFGSGILKINKVQQKDEQNLTYNQEQKCYMMYETNLLGLSQQKMQVARPKKSLTPSDRFSDIKNAYQNCEFERIEKYSNRMAERDSQGNLILDFKDNSILYSSKNMILEDEFSEACLVLGKKREDIFLLDIMSPFNFLQGFFIAISNLDRKLLVR